MENTIKNKAKFFAQYFGQDVFFDRIDFGAFGIDVLRHSWVEGIHAKLKPLSSITDEDALELHKISYPNDINHSVIGGFRILACIDDNICNFKDGTEIVFKLLPELITADYLRSKGYAISWMGLSVEKQIEYGWIKLIEE